MTTRLTPFDVYKNMYTYSRALKDKIDLFNLVPSDSGVTPVSVLSKKQPLINTQCLGVVRMNTFI